MTHVLSAFAMMAIVISALHGPSQSAACRSRLGGLIQVAGPGTTRCEPRIALDEVYECIKKVQCLPGVGFRWIRITGDREGLGSVLLHYADGGAKLGGLVNTLAGGFEGFVRFGSATVSIRTAPDAQGVFFVGGMELEIDESTASVVNIVMDLSKGKADPSAK